MACLRGLVAFFLVATPSVLGVTPSNGPSAASSRIGSRSLESYSFLQFMKDFGRGYPVGSEEFRTREMVFLQSLARAHALNERNAKEGRPWSSGIHPFMDWTDKERKVLHGYKPSARRQGASSSSSGFMAAIQTSAARSHRSGASMQMNLTARTNTQRKVEIRNQGDCGSCWAISTVEAVEEQLALSGIDVQLSAQALVDCVQNPQHCGGTGGCDGATAELGMQFIRDYGIPLEEDFPYSAKTESCPNSLTGPWPTAKRARVSGWNQLPSNKADPLLHALMLNGPVTIAVDGGNWMDYSTGVFDGCDRDATLSHGVLLKGFGETTKAGGGKYWLIQNSWGEDWGEKGHIRLRRHENEDDWCGIDNKPKDGVGCDGGPSEVRVCGMCGLLYDPVQPEGAKLEGGNSKTSAQDKTTYPGEEQLPAGESQQKLLSADPMEDLHAKMERMKKQGFEDALKPGA